MHGEPTNECIIRAAAAHNPQVLVLALLGEPGVLFKLEWHPASPWNMLPWTAGTGLGVPQWTVVAQVLHTSGTTSKPKIVPLTHVNLVVASLCIGSTLQLLPMDICLNIMPLFHLHDCEAQGNSRLRTVWNGDAESLPSTKAVCFKVNTTLAKLSNVNGGTFLHTKRMAGLPPAGSKSNHVSICFIIIRICCCLILV